MRLHAGMTACPALVGGFGKPGMRDLDIGRHVVDCLQQLEWPAGVVIEDLSCSAPLVLHRLQELRPAKIVLLGAVARGVDPPGSLRRYRLDEAPAAPGRVRRSLEQTAMGVVDIDHTLTIARHWGELPVDTVVIEVEPADIEFGVGFSEVLAASFDPILDMVRAELAGIPAGDVEAEPAAPDVRTAGAEAFADLVRYAGDHARSRARSSSPSTDGACPGVALAGRVRPWGVGTESGGDWYDAIPLDGGRMAIVVGDVPGRGVEVAVAMADLRAAVRAYAMIDGTAPARLADHLDRLALTTGIGRNARLLYLVLDPAAGSVRLVNAGGCPPLVIDGARGRFVDIALSGPVGEPPPTGRSEATLELASGATIVLCTGGLIESRKVPRAIGMERLRQAAVHAPAGLDGLCDYVLADCTAALRRDDDICLLALRL